MPAKVHGKDVIFSVLDGGTFHPLLCSTNCSLTTNTEAIPTTTYSSGSNRSFRPRLNDYSLSLYGLTVIEGEGGMLWLLNRQKNGETFGYQLAFTDTEDTVTYITGYAFITSSTFNGDATAFSDFQLELQGTGAYTVADLPTENFGEVNLYEYDAIGGETEISNVAITNKTVLEVMRDGIAYKVILTGTPAGNQVKYTTSTGTLTFGAALGVGEWIAVQYK
jgi:hypothetical protein